MSNLGRLYRDSLSLLTDLYQLTMAYGHWKLDRLDTEAVFHLFFRQQPFSGGYTVACGLANVVEYIRALRFADEDVAYLDTLTGSDGQPLFDRAFLDHLRDMRFSCDVDAVEEGTVVFPHEPLVRVRGPILQAQLIESTLLNIVNFQSLVATKAARVCLAAGGDPVLEFGLRRAQGMDGAVTVSRSSYIGGCTHTSNVLAGKLFGIPVKGTHAHGWVMSFDDELEAFDQYAKAMPNNCVLLVDTYDTLQGVRHAVEVGRRLRAAGGELIGIRLDSGDLAYLSIEARRILDEGGFPDALIIASSDLDEHIIASLKDQGATIGMWGVGTRLATAFDDPALGGVYKLTSVRKPGGSWEYRVKVSEQAAKTTTPGVLQVRRFMHGDGFEADAIYDEQLGIDAPCTIVDPIDPTRRKRVASGTPFEDLLVPVFRTGDPVYEPPSAHDARQRTQSQLAGLHPAITRMVNPHDYPAGLELRLHELRTKLVLEAREVKVK